MTRRALAVAVACALGACRAPLPAPKVCEAPPTPTPELATCEAPSSATPSSATPSSATPSPAKSPLGR